MTFAQAILAERVGKGLLLALGVASYALAAWQVAACWVEMLAR